MDKNYLFPFLVNNIGYVDPSIFNYFIDKGKLGLSKIDFDFKNSKINPYINFILHLSSMILKEYDIKHDIKTWFIDAIQYNLKNDTNIDSGLALHKEDDNGYNLVSVIFYLRKDDKIKDGNLIVVDKFNNHNIIRINSETTIIMDGRIKHQPQLCSGSGYRQNIIVSFIRNY